MSRSRLLILSVLFCPFSVAATDVHVSDPWIKEAPPGARVMAGYLLLENKGGDPLVLSGIHSPAFDRVELHRSVIENDVVHMEALAELTLKANETLAFEPGGYHLMLYEPRTRLIAGDRVELKFRFSGGHDMTVTAEVLREHRNRSDHQHHHHDHKHHHH